jgi:hypothetical protein
LTAGASQEIIEVGDFERFKIDEAKHLKSTGFFTITAPDGRKTDPIPYDATMNEAQEIASKVGIRIEDVWGDA